MSERKQIDPEGIAEATGVPIADVEAVLRELLGNWLFSHHVAWIGSTDPERTVEDGER
jgi:hypothetical protein